MAKRIYQVGEPCDYCNTPTIQGKDGNGYCWPCWAKWKESKSSPQATQSTQRPQAPQTDPKLAEVLKKISERLNSIDAELERQKWFLDEILKRLDPKWSALAQDEATVNDTKK